MSAIASRLEAKILLVLSTAGFMAVAPLACTNCPDPTVNARPGAAPAGAQCFTLEEISQHTFACGGNGTACVILDDCPKAADLVGLDTCKAVDDGPWVKDCECCYTGHTIPMCGRPFVVAGENVRADVRGRADWLAAARSTAGNAMNRTSVEGSSTARARVAQGWLDDARLEHASIASFARFTLELLALGAPAELVADAQRAGLDEVAHARSCFALASRHAGRSLGPGPLSIGGAVFASTLADAAAAAVREGCIGETIASLVAAEQRAVARDEEAREALDRIATDEAEHAVLAYRFVAWAVREGGEPVRASVERAFAEARPQRYGGEDGLIEPMSSEDVAYLHHHGRLTDREAARVGLDAWHSIIGPAAGRLVAVRGSETISALAL